MRNSGGCLLTAIVNELNAVLIEVDEKVDIIMVEIDSPIGKARIMNCYGPQEYNCLEEREKFWNKLEEEIDNA